MGRTNTAEYPRIAGRSPVVVLFSSVPEFVNFPLKSLGRVVVLASASVNYQDALKYYKEGITLLLSPFYYQYFSKCYI